MAKHIETIIPSKKSNPTGLHQKYRIFKADMTDVAPGEYFVLRLDPECKDTRHRDACIKAILLYANEIADHMPDLARDIRNRYRISEEEADAIRQEIAQFDAEVIELAIPDFMDPSTNNGDWRKDAEFRMGWNACRDAMKNRADQLRQKALEVE